MDGAGPRPSPAALVEGALMRSDRPLSEEELAALLPDPAALGAAISEVARDYDGRGVQLVEVAGGWAFRTAPDLARILSAGRERPPGLTRAALEALAAVAYWQPVTRREIEDVRGVSLGKGTLDALLAAGLVRPAGRRATPGRPLTWATTPAFLDAFGLPSLSALPGVQAMREDGVLDRRRSVTPSQVAGDADGDGGDGDEPGLDPGEGLT
jgi:segregation and condensation protein B